MISDARGGHVSPGVYTEVRDIQYSTKSLGITTLGVAGETLKGPAFQPISIASWTDFTDYFGGTSPIKFKGTNYPKYELPYIAKAYLAESKQLEVVRVLGLSGYWAGKAWIISTSGVSAEESYRYWEWKEVDSAGTESEEVMSGYTKPTDHIWEEGDKVSGITEPQAMEEVIALSVDEINMPVAVLRSKKTYSGATSTFGICTESNEEPKDLVVNIDILDYSGNTYGANCQLDGNSYEVKKEGVAEFDPSCGIDVSLGKFALKVRYYDPNGTLDESGKTISTADTGAVATCSEVTYNVSMDPSDPDYLYKIFPEDPLMGAAPLYIESVYDMATYKALRDAAFAVSHDESGVCISSGQNAPSEDAAYLGGKVKFPYQILGTEGPEDYFEENANKFHYWNYISTYRCAVTPWIVSEVKAASTETIDVKKLFKVYTISDGNAANYQVKVSIQRIRPVEGLFDLVVRDFYDTDNSQVVLEKYTNCSMVEGESNFVGLKVGTIDGTYPNKSKYIALEFSNEEGVDDCVPCGFLGYPIPKYETVCGITMNYNTVYDNTIKPKRQYFGLNDEVLDYDVLNYKGVDAYADGVGDADPSRISNGFHLDSIFSVETAATIQVDGESGYTFTTVDPIQMNKYNRIPRILPTDYLDQCLYKDINLRKFTVYPYGGFDGWDINRDRRTNTDEYRGNKYSLRRNNDGYDYTEIFRPIGGKESLDLDPMVSLKLPNIAITTDYYAYLAGYMQFANPEDVDINLFATPGINWYDQTLLSEDALDIIEDSEDGRGGDALYIMAAPQYDSDMMAYGPEDVASYLEETEIDSPYACTYYPWVKYWDGDNKKYIDLPPTKDVVRDMAATDNVSFPWFSPAGLTRGEVDCAKAFYKTTLLDEDTLYENMINPIKTFAVDGVKVWGNKTLYHQETPRNRINVSRLMIRVKKLVSQAARNLIFEQYDVTLEKQFRSVVEPILQDVKANRGIYDYRIVTESTEETRDQHILPAKILIKPTPALEYISISFVVYPESVEFDESL